MADATRSLRANDKPVTEEQHRALLEQVQAARDPSAFPTSLCASSSTLINKAPEPYIGYFTHACSVWTCWAGAQLERLAGRR